MLWLVATALAASPAQEPPSAPVRATVQARATVRILAGVQLRLDGQPNEGAPEARDTVVHTEGTPHVARLIEFQ